MWSDVQLAPESQTLVVPEHLVANGVASVDFLKIDVDGADLEVLHSFDAALESLADHRRLPGGELLRVRV